MRISLLLPMIAMSLSCSFPAAAGPDDEGESERLGVVAQSVGGMMEAYHYAPHQIDDATSEQWLGQYMRRLDYDRLYFTQSDVDEFAKWRTTLDDALASRDLSPAYDIHARYRQRLEERLTFADAFLAGDVDLSTSDFVQLDREEAPYASDASEQDVLWSALLREQVLRSVLGGKTKEEAIELIKKRYERRRRDVETLPPIDIVELYLGSLTSTFDPHSTWFAPATHDNFGIDMSDSVEGIGAQLQTDGDYTKIVNTIAGGPAELSEQLSADDRILSVAQGSTGEFVDVVGERIDDVVRLIRGEKGTTVRLTIWPASSVDPASTKVVELIRDKVQLERAAATVEVHEVIREGNSWQVAVIDVPSFYVDWSTEPSDPNHRSASVDVRRILSELGPEIDAVAIDLRQNGGGSLDESVNLTGLFIDRGPVVQTRDAQGEVEVLRDSDRGAAWDGPLTVMTSVYSASASEIFAAAIQDYNRGLVIGASTTHGKGTVQNVFDLGRFLGRSRMLNGEDAEAVGGAVKYTTQKFYRVNGGSTQNRGVRPHIVLPSSSDGLDVLESDLDYALEYDEIEPVALRNEYTLSADIAALGSASAGRVATSPAFGFMAEDMTRRNEREGQPLSLNLETRQRDLTEAEEREAARKVTLGIETCAEDAEDCEEERIDPVRDETLQIVADWLEQSKTPVEGETASTPSQRSGLRSTAGTTEMHRGPSSDLP